jgi:hypothetical protein
VSKLAGSMFDLSAKAQRAEAGDFLETIWQGLEYLCQQVERIERKRLEFLGSIEEAARDLASVELDYEPDAMLCNYFLWYASALYNFIGVFNKAFSPSEDLREEFASVITWRHKVSAHTSWVSPRRDDTLATQTVSIALYPQFPYPVDQHFWIGAVFIFSEEMGGLTTGGNGHLFPHTSG